VITARTTRLVRTADLAAFRDVLVALAIDGPPLSARDRLVLVPTRAAAAHLVRTIEDGPGAVGAVVLPDLITAGELVGRLADRLPAVRPRLGDAEREVLLGVACRAARDAGHEPPFRLRPGLIAEILRFYDALRRQHTDVDVFERLALGMLEPGAVDDRGAVRLVAQTRFLVAAFREFERRCGEQGDDEHALRGRLLHESAAHPVSHVVVACGDRAFEPGGLVAADWDLLARLPDLQRLDVVVTDTTLAGPLHERIHRLLPGIEEVRSESAPRPSPVLLIDSSGTPAFTARDREEEVAAFARRVKHDVRNGAIAALDRVALVVHQPLPYLYVAREVLRSGGIPCQMFDTLPLAAEPYAAALDLVFSCISSGFSRRASVALLASPHFRFGDGHARLSAVEIAALDRALSEAGYLGELPALEALVAKWREAPPARGPIARGLAAAEVLCDIARSLEALRSPSPTAAHLDTLVTFLSTHERLGDAEGPGERHLRARGAILTTLLELRDAYARFDAAPVAFDDVSALVRRWIEGQTFAPHVGDHGVHVVDAVSARFGDFDVVQLAGLIDGEWPDRPRRSIFYSSAILRELGWPAESDRIDGARTAFRDLLRLPSARIAVSTFSLEADAIVAPSALIDEIASADLAMIEDPVPALRIFDHEALSGPTIDLASIDAAAHVWARWRLSRAEQEAWPAAGATDRYIPATLSLSAVERYQDCPFKFFASDVLRLEEPPDEEPALSPRVRGRFIHELFQQCFAAWDARRGGPITSDRIDAARRLFGEIAAPMLARLPEAEAALERSRLFGSAISVGLVDVVLGLEASHPVRVERRWLEHALEGTIEIGDGGPACREASPTRDPARDTGPGEADVTHVRLKGIADRIDLLDGHRLRVIDYKSGAAPNPKRALQVATYASFAQAQLVATDATPWSVDEATYVAFTGRRPLVPVVRPGGREAEAVLDEVRTRVGDLVGGITRSEFPPRPYDEAICRYCAYASVCRKDYAAGD
jgi:RecB family exonuclease